MDWRAAAQSCRWEFPASAEAADDDGVVAVGADLDAETLVYAYANGMFPMRLQGRSGALGWWSPDPRGIMPLDGLVVSRSLRRSRRRFEISVNRSFEAVVRACGDPQREGAWIDDSFVDAYSRLHTFGTAHSVEVWLGERLVGGLYGVRLGGFFAGESMFHRETDASKVALWAVCDLLCLDGAQLFDVQWTTDHLRSLGAVDVSRADYLARLAAALA